MIDASRVEKEIERVGEELDMPTPTPLGIVDVRPDEMRSLLHVIAEDRPDKAAALGMGGIVLHKVARSLGFRKAIVTSMRDIEVKRSRVLSSVRAQRKHRHVQYVSIYGVLRECHSGILEPVQALRYIKSITGWAGCAST